MPIAIWTDCDLPCSSLTRGIDHLVLPGCLPLSGVNFVEKVGIYRFWWVWDSKTDSKRRMGCVGSAWLPSINTISDTWKVKTNQFQRFGAIRLQKLELRLAIRLQKHNIWCLGNLWKPTFCGLALREIGIGFWGRIRSLRWVYCLFNYVDFRIVSERTANLNPSNL